MEDHLISIDRTETGYLFFLLFFWSKRTITSGKKFLTICHKYLLTCCIYKIIIAYEGVVVHGKTVWMRDYFTGS
jgi:hypothetical protein